MGKISEINGLKFWGEIFKKATQKRMPMSVMMELTYQCNLKCGHCYVVPEKGKEELKLKEIKFIIDQLKELGCLSIIFSGGDLFTRKDIFSIFEYVKKEGFFIEFLTNATLIDDEIAKQLGQFPPDKIHITLYGISREVYKKVTGKDSLSDCLSGIERIRKLKIPMKINTLVTKDNLEEISRIEALAKKINADFHSDPNIQPNWDYSLKTLENRVLAKDYNKSMRFSPYHREKLFSAKGDAPLSRKKENSSFNGCQKEPSDPIKLFPCDVGRTSMVIDPYGSVYLCQSLPFPRFNANSGRLRKAWKELVDYRNSFQHEKRVDCQTCDLIDYCDWCPGCGEMETGHFSRCVPYLKEAAMSDKQEHETTIKKTIK